MILGDGEDLLLHTSSAVQLRRITERRLHTQRRLASKVIIAVPWLSDETGAADDDVCLEGVAGAVDGVWDVAGPFPSCWVAGRGLVCVGVMDGIDEVRLDGETY
jgi:hypothetical protein